MADNFNAMHTVRDKAVKKAQDKNEKIQKNDNFNQMHTTRDKAVTKAANKSAGKNDSNDNFAQMSKSQRKAQEEQAKSEAKSSKKSSKKKGSKDKNKDSDNSLVGTGMYFYGHMSADIVRQVLDMFVLQVKPIGGTNVTTTKKNGKKVKTSTDNNGGSLINLMYNYMGNDGKKRHIHDLITTNIPEPELQAKRVLDEMNGKTKWRIFNPDEGMEQDPVQFMAYNGSVGQMIRDLSNAPFNEVFWTHEASSKAKLNYRQTPFEQEEWSKLITIPIDNSDVISMDLNASDDEQYSIFDLESDYLLNNIGSMAYLLPVTDDYNELISRYGYKYMEVSSQYFFNDVIGSGLTSDELKQAQQTQEEESTNVNANYRYPSLATFDEFFPADSKSALSDKNEDKVNYKISKSFGGNGLYEIISKDVANNYTNQAIKQDIKKYRETHKEFTRNLNTNALTELNGLYQQALKQNKGKSAKLSVVQYVDTMLPPQEHVYPSTNNDRDYLSNLKYILSKGYAYIGKSTNRMKQAAQDLVLMSQGNFGSLQAYRLIQAYVKGKGVVSNDDYQKILKTVKHSDLEKGVNTAASLQTNKSGGQDFYARYNKYQIKLFNWFADNSKFYSGNIVVTGRLGVEYGKKLYFTDKRRGVNWEFYIESVQHDFDFQSGWVTTIGVTRGLQVSKPNDPKRWSMYWGHAKAFTGGFFGELSLQDIINQAKIREANEENSGGNSGGDDTDTPSAKGPWVHPVKTVNGTSWGKYLDGGQFGNSAASVSARGHEFHDGFDFSRGYYGATIRAMHAGKVTFAGAHSGLGTEDNMIRIKSGNWTQVYQEFGSGGTGIKVKKNQKVAKGKIIGIRTTGTHTHVGITDKPFAVGWSHSFSDHGGGWVDPIKFLKEHSK